MIDSLFASSQVKRAKGRRFSQQEPLTVRLHGLIRNYPKGVGVFQEYFFFVTNTELPSEKVVISYEKRGNAENYIKEAKYDMAVGHLLLKSFWANEAVFQMMMLAYNLFLLFKFDSLHISEYRQQIKTFRLKYVFLAAKIIKTARYVAMCFLTSKTSPF